MRPLIALCFFVMSLLTASGVQAQDRYTSVKIIPERTHVKTGQTITIATEITMAEGWHVYWLNPGDSGLPVKITWNEPYTQNFGEIKWPIPDKISYDILLNYGYYDRVALLQDLTLPPALPDGKIELSAKVDMLVCKEICIPESSTVTLTLNDPSAPVQDNSTYITQVREKLPKPLAGSFTYIEKDKQLHLNLTLTDSAAFSGVPAEKIDFFPEALGVINHITPPKAEKQDKRIQIIHERGTEPMTNIETLRGLLVVLGAQGENIGYTVHAQRQSAATPSGENKATSPDVMQLHPHADLSLLAAVAFALLGGLILNLMPCVFPVLSMKALSLVKLSEKESALARRHGLAYTAGVVLSFLLIGGLLLALKSGGSAVGWGFQLQNPVVVAVLAYMLFLLGLNLLGAFEIGGRLSNIGQSLTQKSGLSGSFFTGVLATIVATPCTAPFMGAAMGFALLQPALISLSIFAALGLGLALPYLVLSFVPAARRLLPRPGAWMDTFKQVLSFPMFASAIWLTWVIAQQSGTYSILIVLGSMLSLGLGVWLLPYRGLTARAILLLAFAMPVLSLSTLMPMPEAPSFGEAFSPKALEEALQEDDPVFVEMTAAWCITCKVNHATSLNIAATQKLFAEKKIRYFIGDWTNYNAQITEYLNKYQRDGVPIYVYYGPRDPQTQQRPEAKILPQVLTPEIVRQTIAD